MKSVRQKRIEEDNNKEWAQVRYSKLEHSDRSLPNFDNTQYWNGVNESSTWTTNGTRGVALPDPYYNGYKVSDEYTTPIDPLLYAIGLMKAATIQMNALGVLGSGAAATAIGTVIGKITANKEFQYYMAKSFQALMEGKSIYEYLDVMDQIFIDEIIAAGKLTGILCSITLTTMMWFLFNGILAGNTYKDIYDAWNSFEQDSINAQHKVDTEVDEDGNPLWSGYTVKYSIDYGNTTTTQSSSMKLFKHHQLKRGRYQSKAYSKSNVVYTFNYTKSITYIPA